MAHLTSFPAINELITLNFAPAPLLTGAQGNCSTIKPSDPAYAQSDCGGARVQACISQKLCPMGECTAPVRRSMAKFLGCYEGPVSENDGAPNATTLRPCLLSSGLDVAAVDACNASSEGDAALKACEAKAAVISGYGLGFPYVTLDGQYYSDDTTSLLTEICHLARGRLPAAEVPSECKMQPLELLVTVTCPATGPGNHSYFDFLRSQELVESAVSIAARKVLSNLTFPTNYETQYIHAASQIKGVSVVSFGIPGDINKYHTAPMHVSLDVLAVYQKPLAAALMTQDFKTYVATYLTYAANLTLHAESITVSVTKSAQDSVIV